MKRTNPSLDQARRAARNGYAWPGGHPLAIVMGDGGCICPTCARANWRQIAHNTLMRASDWPDRSWQAIGAEINWEDDDLYCAHCNSQIQSAYGEQS